MITMKAIVRTVLPVLPGLALVGLLAAGSVFLSRLVGQTLFNLERSPLSPVMVAIVLGIAARNLLSLPDFLEPGITVAVRRILRTGIILLGIRLSLLEVLRLGLVGIPIVIGAIAVAILVTVTLARWIQLPQRLVTLIAVGTSICGVSAIVAAGPAIDANDEEIAYSISVVTIFGLLATVLYPYIAGLLFAGDFVAAGLFLGTAIHDTSQVTGAALMFADLYEAPVVLDYAVVTKLVRNLFMVVVIPLLVIHHGGRSAQDTSRNVSVVNLVPLFILGFLGMVGVRSIGDATLLRSGHAFGFFDRGGWSALQSTVQNVAVYLLVAALAGVGLKTRIARLRALGPAPFLMGLAAAISVGAFSAITVRLLSLAGLVPLN